MTSRWIFLILLLYVGAQEGNAGTVLDNVGDSLKMAGQMFGINTAADVANLVAQAFSGNGSRGKPLGLMSILQHGFQPSEDQAEQNQSEQQEEPPQEDDGTRRPPHPPPLMGSFDSGQLLTNMLRMVGFDARKLGALALNAIIMIAQAIGNTLMQATRGGAGGNNGAAFEGPEALYEPNDHQPRSLSMGSPIDWFLQRPGTHSKRLLGRIMDRDLPEHILDMIESKEDLERGHEAGCLKMLMCKSKPIIWGMQNSLKKRLAGEPELPEEQENHNFFNKGIFFKFLPSLKDFKEHSAGCETRFNEECPRNATTQEY
ncbi:GL18431 [Drosophila persimilis]|uniref:GL18431 n=1 Tax=Drosophila persimilis TaxID=7234 RepID=B4HA65_DROPE|nr:uncharacterized protein LOC6602719 [Drosophila persimilis]EDW36749.1 GL18431 [Drosophila persimilis]